MPSGIWYTPPPRSIRLSRSVNTLLHKFEVSRHHLCEASMDSEQISPMFLSSRYLSHILFFLRVTICLYFEPVFENAKASSGSILSTTFCNISGGISLMLVPTKVPRAILAPRSTVPSMFLISLYSIEWVIPTFGAPTILASRTRSKTNRRTPLAVPFALERRSF